MAKIRTLTSDFRETNPALHLLYVKWAVQHLAMLDRMLAELWGCSNMNMHGPAAALQKERNKLTTYDAAYLDADEILKSLKGTDNGTACD